MAKTVTIGGQTFTPNKEIEKKQRESNKRIQKIINNLKRAEESLIQIWFTEHGKVNIARQRKKVLKNVQPWEEAKAEEMIYNAFFTYLNQGAKKHDFMFKLGVKQSETGLEILFEAPQNETKFNERATEALKKIKF